MGNAKDVWVLEAFARRTWSAIMIGNNMKSDAQGAGVDRLRGRLFIADLYT